MQKIILASGYFNPLHIGHIRYLNAAKALGGELIVIVNNDEQVTQKGNQPFMSQEERLEIIKNLRSVDYAVISVDTDKTQRKSLSFLGSLLEGKNVVFAKGGDITPENLPKEEVDICKKHKVRIIYDVGGGKIQSSSWLLKGSI